jgi:hypothetical protein
VLLKKLKKPLLEDFGDLGGGGDDFLADGSEANSCFN